MRYCSNCGKKLEDDMQFCPNCGISVPLNSEDQAIDEITVEEKPKKKKHEGIVIVIIILVILIGTAFLYYNNARADVYNQFVNLYNTMAEGAAKAETANILIIDVWKNSIWKINDAKTNKFTRKNGGSGQFYEDFNDALENLYADEDFLGDIAEIYSLQSEAETLIKDLAKRPKSFDEEYSDFKECYNLFVKFTDMPLTSNGSLNSFTDEHNELDSEFAYKLKELDIYFD